jgi:hypothetical protein
MVEELITRARRRFVMNEGLAQTALAASVAIGGFALLLIVGTRYLEAWTLSLFAAAGIGIGAWQLSRRIPGKYETARRVDESAGLQDALSTALYFSTSQPLNGSGSDAYRRAQREQAEQLSGSVHLETAVPFTFPRSVYAMAATAILVSALIGLRYRSGRGIDLRAPITQVLFQDLAAPLAGKEAKKEGRNNRAAMEKAIDQALEGPRPFDKKDDPKKGETKADSTQPSRGDPMENNDPTVFDSVDLEGNQASAKEGDDSEKKTKELTQAEKESLISKLKEAVENLLSKNKKEMQDAQKNQQQAKRSDSKNGEKNAGQKGEKQKGQDDQSSEQEAEAEADAERAQKEAQSKQNSSSQAQQQAQEGSGIGKSDGKKDIKLAEQLKAMGKISEIIGQRSSDVSGETTIELQSGDQNLTTAYSNTKAAHGETDGDVTRDQIPLALQAYVQQYFQEVRKVPGGAKKAAPAPAAPAK